MNEFEILGVLPLRVKLRFSCSGIHCCWDEFTGEAWFNGSHRLKEMESAFKELGFEAKFISTEKPVQRNFGAGMQTADKIRVFKHSESDRVYEVVRADDNGGFRIRSARDTAAAASDNFSDSVYFGDSINAREL